jgi:hypothetical protein
MTRHDQVGPDEATVRRRQASKDGDRYCEGWIGHDAKGSLWKSKVGGVGLDDGDVVACESPPKFVGPNRVQFKGNYLRATL